MGLQGRKTREYKGAPRTPNRSHSLQVRQLERFQILPPSALKTQNEEEMKKKFSLRRVYKTSGIENTENIPVHA